MEGRLHVAIVQNLVQLTFLARQTTKNQPTNYATVLYTLTTMTIFNAAAV